MSELEEWRSVREPRFRISYEVSNLGRVRSVDREYWNNYNGIWIKGQLLKL